MRFFLISASVDRKIKQWQFYFAVETENKNRSPLSVIFDRFKNNWFVYIKVKNFHESTKNIKVYQYPGTPLRVSIYQRYKLLTVYTKGKCNKLQKFLIHCIE